MKRRTALVAALVAAGLLAAAGIAYAVIPDATGEYHACMHKSTGAIRLIDPSLGTSSLLSHCLSPESEVSWNKQGRDGISPTVAQLAAGDANCPAGGASITDAAGNTAHVCNGTNGTNGEDFAGTFTSPNGQYTLTVGDAGITLQGPGGKVKLDGPNTTVEAAANLDLKAGAIGKLESGGPTQVQGALVQLNGCSAPVARRGDLVVGSVTVGPDGGTFPFNNALILPLAATVCTG